MIISIKEGLNEAKAVLEGILEESVEKPYPPCVEKRGYNIKRPTAYYLL